MKLKGWREVVMVDFPPSGPITRKSVALALKEGSRFRGSMRVSTGRVWTDREFEKYREKVLSTPLP
jgi:hypothetical protein